MVSIRLKFGRSYDLESYHLHCIVHGGNIVPQIACYYITVIIRYDIKTQLLSSSPSNDISDFGHIIVAMLVIFTFHVSYKLQL